MEAESTLLLNRTDVQRLLSLTECVVAVERVFRLQGEGKIPSSGILGVRTQSGGLHVKIACLSGAKNYIVAKLNTNFAQNYARFGLPTIQGAIVLYEDVAPGTFIAAVGADDSHKNEIDPAVLASAKVVGDSLEQVCSIGDTHHAIAASLMRKEDVYGELSEIVAGRKPGRTIDAEIIIFDSTGIAIEDAAAATIVYEKACAAKIMNNFEFTA